MQQFNLPSITLQNALPCVVRDLVLGHAPMLWGSPGIGKSSMFQQIANEAIYYTKGSEIKLTYYSNSKLESQGWEKNKGIKLVVEYLSQIAPEDLRGLTGINEVTKKTEAYYSERLPKEGDGPGIYLLDEISSAPPHIQVVAYQLLLDKKIGDHSLPSYWGVAAAGNDPSCGAVCEDISTALADRLSHFFIKQDARSWLDWANSVQDVVLNESINTPGIRPEILALIRTYPEFFDKYGTESNTGMVEPTPRSVVKASNLWHLYSENSSAEKNNVADFLNSCRGNLYGLFGKNGGEDFISKVQQISSRPDLDILLNPHVTVKQKTNLLKDINTSAGFWGLMYSLGNHISNISCTEEMFERKLYEISEIIVLIQKVLSTAKYNFPMAEAEVYLIGKFTSLGSNVICKIILEGSNDFLDKIFGDEDGED